MKTFETEKNNMLEGATHYRNECEDYLFYWLKITEGTVPKVWVRRVDTEWRVSDYEEHLREGVRPIPQQEEGGQQEVDWKNGDEDDHWVKQLMYTLYDEGYQKKGDK